MENKKCIPKNTPYCYEHTHKYIECCHYKHVYDLEGFCELLKCEVTDQVKECGFSGHEEGGMLRKTGRSTREIDEAI